MPFKSKAQRRKFAELLVKGEISEETFEEWNRETGSAKLPEYAQPKVKRAPKSKPRGRARKTSKPGPQKTATRSKPKARKKAGSKRP